MRPLSHPRTGEGTVVLGVLLLTVLEMTVLATAPRTDCRASSTRTSHTGW
jgi:hypothetical protein